MSAHRHAVPPSASASGITAAQHAAQLLAGNEWCAQKRHYIRSTCMTTHSTATCADCARELRAARKARTANEKESA